MTVRRALRAVRLTMVIVWAPQVRSPPLRDAGT